MEETLLFQRLPELSPALTSPPAVHAVGTHSEALSPPFFVDIIEVIVGKYSMDIDHSNRR